MRAKTTGSPQKVITQPLHGVRETKKVAPRGGAHLETLGPGAGSAPAKRMLSPTGTWFFSRNQL